MEQKICPVDVISICSASGEIRPLRLRLEDESRQEFRINIEKILSVTEVEHIGAEAVVYLCRAHVWGRPWIFELKYMFRTHTWSMTRQL